MGVQVRIVLYAPEEAEARAAAQAAFDRIAALDRVMSDYNPESELMQLAARAGGPPVRVSEDLFRVLARAQELARRSEGAFDVTVAPYVQLWREARRTGLLPSLAAQREAAARVGWQKLRLDPAARTAALQVPGMQLDLGGIAKGYAADRALEVLRREGTPRALIEMGGDIVAAEAPPGRAGWSVRVAHAAPEARDVVLANAAISSSGDTEQYVEVDGRRYSHVVDPRTGVGLTSRIAATVIAPDGFTSDGLATLLTTLGPERGLPLLDRHYPEARAYVRRADDFGSE